MSEAFSPWQARALDGALDALARGRLGHATLLRGPERLGKRAVADALARRLLCTQAEGAQQACGACRGCRLLASGTHPDFRMVTLEVNPNTDKLRTEIVIEQIRQLGEWFALTSQFGGAQVALIDPADQLNVAAANALLKTLEEPSQDRYLLLVGSRPARLPATIRSRCQSIEFRLPPHAEALAWLARRGGGDAGTALEAARGHPGLAAEWLDAGALALRAQVRDELAEVGAGTASAVEVAARWTADEQAPLRLRFAADLALERAGELTGAQPQARSGLTAVTAFQKLSAWFDAANRTRDLLRTTVRADLAVAGLLHQWRDACAGARGEAPTRRGTR
ncbi:DNA polymerase III subunit delta' [Coralloluteibacterium stylophorae]|uniref:DNA-directed DNA polymerase n=3 Tax=Coralloluteibacterium stylophorae TaxID=1776034 RepID=A0AAP2CC20_9GAMM|nr:DNA polymerase III subunit delta' [Coralloluteibacterium stylophorae]MBS7457624.1 DNA polymerase III subunit delta' [Coralloluteibacterium stylophorae]